MALPNTDAAKPGLSPLHAALREAAARSGFIASGGVDISLASAVFSEHVDRLDRWLEEGYHGTMEWIRRGRDRRADPTQVFQDAQSIFCVLLPYSAKPHGRLDPNEGVRYARYLKGSDYHEDVAAKLNRVLTEVAEAQPDLKLQWKTCVDTSAVLERSWAYLAGLGWIGKNTLLIHPKWGSYHFIGAALLNHALDQAPNPMPNWCGSCERCLKQCPTNAFPQAGILDSNRCISALTLENRSETLPTQPELSTGTWVAGCDICQEVCPFNLKRSRSEMNDSIPDFHPSDWKTLMEETEADYRVRVKNSALARVKPQQFKRNLEAAARNSQSQVSIEEKNHASVKSE